MTAMSRADDILQFWFGDLDEAGQASKVNQQRWWRKSEETDHLCRERFAMDLAAARAGQLDGWLASPRTCLALVILCDQLSRNIHRDTAEAADDRARQATRHALGEGFDRGLRPIEQAFLLMPLMHAEDLADQEEAVRRRPMRRPSSSRGRGRAFSPDCADARVAALDVITSRAA
jgi:uncharacterized protein (DUF924 family)